MKKKYINPHTKEVVIHQASSVLLTGSIISGTIHNEIAPEITDDNDDNFFVRGEVKLDW